MFAVIGQVIGAAVGGLIIFVVARGMPGYQRGSFASNGYDTHSLGGYNLGSAMLVEVVFTALLVVVVLFTTTHKFSVGMGGLVVGLTLTLFTSSRFKSIRHRSIQRVASGRQSSRTAIARLSSNCGSSLSSHSSVQRSVRLCGWCSIRRVATTKLSRPPEAGCLPAAAVV